MSWKAKEIILDSLECKKSYGEFFYLSTERAQYSRV